ncbi:PREDICTED: retinoic acid receptor RXR-beta-like [Calidris pugnax]|uniref:retinoic acid receptor RXR-beta-like n=1 Tax=Calidris pugnax TaxID=198806 RepID=UPI00071E27DA|nr:PREDICTED: retinoic acid receptor RXR-beta-like [Calidris pugnax]
MRGSNEAEAIFVTHHLIPAPQLRGEGKGGTAASHRTRLQLPGRKREMKSPPYLAASGNPSPRPPRLPPPLRGSGIVLPPSPPPPPPARSPRLWHPRRTFSPGLARSSPRRSSCSGQKYKREGTAGAPGLGVSFSLFCPLETVRGSHEEQAGRPRTLGSRGRQQTRIYSSPPPPSQERGGLLTAAERHREPGRGMNCWELLPRAPVATQWEGHGRQGLPFHCYYSTALL